MIQPSTFKELHFIDDDDDIPTTLPHFITRTTLRSIVSASTLKTLEELTNKEITNSPRKCD